MQQIIEPTAEFEQSCLQIVRRWRSGDLTFPDARKQLMQLAQQAQADKSLANQGRAYFTLGFLFAMTGRHTDAAIWQNNALRLFEKVNNPARIARCHLSLGESYRYRSDYTKAEQHYNQAFEYARQADDELNQIFARGNAGHLANARGNHAAARDLLVETLARLEEYMKRDASDWAVSPDEIYCEYGAALSDAYFGLGDRDNSWQYALKVYDMARAGNHQMEQGFITRTMALLVLNNPHLSSQLHLDGEAATADKLFEMSCELFRITDAQSDLAQTVYTYGDALAQVGETTQAIQHLRKASTLFTRLGMIKMARTANEEAMQIDRQRN